MALDSLIAARVMFRVAPRAGSLAEARQLFQRQEDDAVNARQIINGNDKDTKIAGYHYTTSTR